MQNSKKNIGIALLSAVIVYFVLANFFKIYRSEMDVLIVPQNEKTALMQKQVLANAAKIPLTVSFFDRLAMSNISINNPVDGFSPAEKKKYWNAKLETKIIKDSGIVKFISRDSDSSQAEIIAFNSASNDIIALSGYYNIKEDITMRIIDGPITASGGQYKSIGIIVISIVIGIIIFAIFVWLIPFIQSRANVPDETFYTKALPEDTFSIKKNIVPETKEEIKAEVYAIPTKKIPKNEPVLPKTPEFISSEKKATAPGNLPIADTSIMNMFGATKNGMGYRAPAQKEAPQNMSKSEEKPAVYREATAEEVKERLNRLLGGV